LFIEKFDSITNKNRFFVLLNSVLTIRSVPDIKKYCFQVLQYFSTNSIAIPHAILHTQVSTRIAIPVAIIKSIAIPIAIIAILQC